MPLDRHMLRITLVPKLGGIALALFATVGCDGGDDAESSSTEGTGAGAATSSTTASGPAGSGGGDAGPGGSAGSGGSGPCVPSGATEATCSDDVDDDCDGFADCLDPDCNGLACGGDGLTCISGACLGEAPLPEVAPLLNVVPTVRGDSVVIDFSAVDGAKDYRVYELPDEGDVLVGEDGEVVVQDAIYRCSGVHPRDDREIDAVSSISWGRSLAGDIHGYTRTEAESVLGHVYLTPGGGRIPIYRVADPNHYGGYAWEYEPVPAKEFNAARYVDTMEERDELLQSGWRDDGIAFYAPLEGTRQIHRTELQEGDVSVFYADGPEKDARDASGAESEASFAVLDAEAEGTVPLHRIFYGFHHEHDVLAAGGANRERVLHQGNTPVTSVMWSGLRGETTLVVEALDAGCPFPGGYIGAVSAPATVLGGIANEPTITLDEARLDTGEVFVNGQWDEESRPRPIARAYVTVEPQPHPEMDWFESFDPDVDLAPFETVVDDNIGTRVFRNGKLSLEYQGSDANHSYGEVLGQLAMGSVASYAATALGADASIAGDDFLHVTMSVDFATTARRYPQIIITDATLGDPDVDLSYDVPLMPRLGPVPSEKLPPGEFHSIIVQPFGQPTMQIQFCDLRGWGVSQQCPSANVYGYPAGVGGSEWTAPWLPMPVVGEVIGTDRLVKLDVYASTERVYAFLEGKPAGCAILPEGRMPSGPVNVSFSLAAYHIEIDEQVTSANPRQGYWSRYSVAHSDRKLDDLGISSGVAAPAWDESTMPCGDRYYSGLL
jgi:hypothetical protein